MNYDEAIKLARSWTSQKDADNDGWRAVIALLLNRVTVLETTNANLHEHLRRMGEQIDALSLDLGFKEKCFEMPPQPQLKTIADIIKECQSKGGA